MQEPEKSDWQAEASQADKRRILDGKFELLQEIGRGSGGIVYKARHLTLDLIVAVKIISPELLNSQTQIKRFQTEASILSNLNHPKIVKFISYGKLEDSGYYMALEYIEGHNLAQILEREGALSEERALPLFIDLCEAVSYLHQNQIIHRDIKPDNLTITESGKTAHAKLIDFGIVKSLSAQAQALTGTTAVIGTSAYMSPEQCLNQALDERSDIYSFACLIYETLVGKSPMQADSELLIMSNHLNKQIEKVPAAYGISQDLESIVLSCLSKDPEKRMQSADELLAKLKSIDPSQKRKRKSRSPQIGGLALTALFVTAILSILLSKTLTHKVVSPNSVLKSGKSDASLLPVQPPIEIGDEYIRAIELEKWIAANIELTNPNEGRLVTASTKLNSTRAHMCDCQTAPYSRQIYKLILKSQLRDQEKLKKSKNTSSSETAALIEQYQRKLSRTAVMQAICGENDKAMKTLKSGQRLYSETKLGKDGLLSKVSDIVILNSDRGKFQEALSFAEFACNFLKAGDQNYDFIVMLTRCAELNSLMGNRSRTAQIATELYQLLLKYFADGNFPFSPELEYTLQLMNNCNKHNEAKELLLKYRKGAGSKILDKDGIDYTLACTYWALNDHAGTKQYLLPIIESTEKKESRHIKDLSFSLYLYVLEAEKKPTGKIIEAYLSKAEKQSKLDKLRSLYQIVKDHPSLPELNSYYKRLAELRTECTGQAVSAAAETSLLAADMLQADRYYKLGQINEALKIQKTTRERLLDRLAKEKSKQSFDHLASSCLREFSFFQKADRLPELEKVHEQASALYGFYPLFDFTVEEAYTRSIAPNQPERAANLLKKLLDPWQNKAVNNLPCYFSALATLDKCLNSLKEHKQACIYLESGIKQLEQYQPSKASSICDLYMRLSGHYKELGQTNSAVEAFNKANYWKKKAQS